MRLSKSLKTSAIFTAAVLSFFLSSCSSGGVTGPAGYTSKVESMDRFLDSVIQATNIPGLVLAYWDNSTGFSYIRSRGYADLDRKTPMDATKLFRIGSLTKSFTTTVLLQMIDEGKIGLEDKLSRYFPELPNSGLVTIRQLADMSSGYTEYFDEPAFKQTVANDPGHVYTPLELFNLVSRHPLKFTPGSQFDYCNTNYILLGMVMEKVTGKKMEDEIWERISVPLGLYDTRLLSGRSVTGNFARGYGFEDSMHEKYPPDYTERVDVSSAWVAGSMSSSINDLRKFAESMAGVKLYSKAMQQERLKYRDFTSPKYGYGIGVLHINNYIGHQGTIYGFNSIMLHDPAKGRTIVAYVNLYSDFLAQALAETLMDKFGVRE